MSKIACRPRCLGGCAEHQGNDPRTGLLPLSLPARVPDCDIYGFHKQRCSQGGVREFRSCLPLTVLDLSSGLSCRFQRDGAVSNFSVPFSYILLYAVFIRRSRKEVFQPHLPVRLPCYDLAPVTSFTLGRSLRSRTSGTPGFHGLTGGVYKARERIHRAMADARLLANPASWSRVADSSPN